MCGIRNIDVGMPHGNCGCGGRKLFTNDEKRERLLEYKKKLELELSAVDEHLAEIN